MLLKGKRTVFDFNCQQTKTGEKITFVENVPFFKNLAAQSALTPVEKFIWTETKKPLFYPKFMGKPLEECCIVTGNDRNKLMFCYQQTRENNEK